jgi:hypothetical protein
MAALSGPSKGTSKSRQLKTFQVDLAYPQATSSSSSSKVSAGAGSAASPAASPVKGGRTDSPALGEAQVLITSDEMSRNTPNTFVHTVYSQIYN